MHFPLTYCIVLTTLNALHCNNSVNKRDTIGYYAINHVCMRLTGSQLNLTHGTKEKRKEQ